MKTMIKYTLFVFTLMGIVMLIGAEDAKKNASNSTIEEGKKLFNKYACQKCHTMVSQNIGKKEEDKKSDEEGTKSAKAPDLSTLSDSVMKPDLKDAKNSREYMQKFLNKKIKRNGKKHKVLFKGSDKDLNAIIDFLLPKEPINEPKKEIKDTSVPNV